MSGLVHARAAGAALGVAIMLAAWAFLDLVSGVRFFSSGAWWPAALAPVLVAPALTYGLVRWRPLSASLPLTIAVTAVAVASGLVAHVAIAGAGGLSGALAVAPSIAPWALGIGWVAFFSFDRAAVVAYQRECLAS